MRALGALSGVVAALWVAACDRNGDPPATAPAAPSSGVVPSVSSAPPVLASSSVPVASSSAPLAASSAPQAPCPPEMSLVGRTCVDKWEAHLVTRDDAGKESAHPHFQRPEAGVTYFAKSEAMTYPQGYVSRKESEAYCKASDKRLCTLAEWSRACRGKRWAMFPWGNASKQGACNVAKIHLLSKMFGNDGRAWKYDEHFNSPKLNQEPGFLEKAGEREACTGEDGVFDMVGNLHEWVADPVTEDLVERLEKEPFERKKQPWHEGNGIFMGGFFSTLKEHGPGCTFITIAHEPKYHDYSTGFRCCASAKLPPDEKPKKKK